MIGLPLPKMVVIVGGGIIGAFVSASRAVNLTETPEKDWTI
jgi:hypothetical protein